MKQMEQALELNFEYLILKQREEDIKSFEETLQDLNNILFQGFRKPHERLPQLLDAEKYLTDKIDYLKEKHIPKHPFIESLHHYSPFDERLMEVLTNKLEEIKFEIQTIKESIQMKKTKSNKEPTHQRK